MTSWIAIILGSAFAGSSAWELARGWRAARWPVATGRLLEAGAQERQSRGTRYVPAVRYEYTVAGQALTATRLRFGWDRLYGSPEAAERALLGMKPGATVPVHYNPQNPPDAVLWPGVRPMMVVLLVIGLAMIGLGVRG
ncbi:MAG TPA: DUF3592 domain-containing protein [Gemmatimonas sp.]|uniref:DUF3592 domain-containing protein n=1 Tax=Gemmatimonas sp. TaxID=1962908 RepID=UPI002ED84968